MVTSRSSGRNGKSLHPLQVRAALMLDGETLASVARQFGVSRPLVSRLVNGRRAGVRGKSAQVYHHLLAIVRRRAA